MDRPDRPTPPETLDPELRAMLEALADEDPETIHAVAAHVDDLAAWAESRPDSRTTPSPGDEIPYPEDVPERADVSRTEIDGSTYYYFQWRDGDKIRSRIERP